MSGLSISKIKYNTIHSCVCESLWYRIHLGGIITEGRERGYMEVKPAPYNVVLDDDTFKGELKLGLRFITTVSQLATLDISSSLQHENGCGV